MSYREAIEDGVAVKKMSRSSTVYLPPCAICGHPVYSMNYIRGRRYTCRDCKAKAGIHKLLKKENALK